MLVNDLLQSKFQDARPFTDLISTQCCEFIRESGGEPIYKLLPDSYNDFQKVKVRQHKRLEEVDQAFNQAFQSYANLRQRTVFANGIMEQSHGDLQPFYIFPINGYKYLYNKEIRDSHTEYKHTLNTLLEQLDNTDAVEMITDLLKYTYTNVQLAEAIRCRSEIMFYNIPYFYAAKVNMYESYQILTGQ